MKPLWKQLFDTVEKAAAPVIADATASPDFAEIVKVGIKISRDMNKQAEALSRRALHALNLPAAGDISYLKTQIGSLEAEIRTLRRTLEKLDAPAQTRLPQAPQSQARKPKAKAKS